MTRNVFVYGTLQFPQIMAAVTGEAFEGIATWLNGYARYCVADAPFPGIAPQPSGRVDGLLYPRIGPRALARIDDFEGDLYRRTPVAVRDADGHEHAAETYVVRPRWRARLVDAPWDSDAFARQWHDAYVRACRAGRAI